MATLKNNQFTDADWQNLWAAYALDVNSFLKHCEDIVRNKSVSNTEKKEAFIRAIKGIRNKDRIVMKVKDFFLAGESLKVVTGH